MVTLWGEDSELRLSNQVVRVLGLHAQVVKPEGKFYCERDKIDC